MISGGDGTVAPWLPLFGWFRHRDIGFTISGINYRVVLPNTRNFLPSLLPNTRNSSYQTPVDNFDYSQPFQKLADRGWAVVECQSIVVVLHPGGVVLEVDHHEIVPEHAF